MQRVVNIYHGKYQNIILENYENIDIVDIDNIVNHSINFIRCTCLEFYDIDTVKRIISILIQKLNIGGTLLIGSKNIKNIAKLYCDTVMDDMEFVSHIKDKKSILSIDLIKALIQSGHSDCSISKIEFDNKNHDYYLSVERIRI